MQWAGFRKEPALRVGIVEQNSEDIWTQSSSAPAVLCCALAVSDRGVCELDNGGRKTFYFYTFWILKHIAVP